MPDNPHIDDKAFFAELDKMELARLDESKGQFPWEQRVFGEDRFSAEDALRDHYAKLNLPAPRISWASSPAALWSAVTMLKQFAMKSMLVDSLVPQKGLVSIEGEAKRSLLSAVLNDDLLVSMGAPITPMLSWKLWNTPPRCYQAIHDAHAKISQGARASDALGRSSTPGRWSDAVIYPALHSEGVGGLAANAFCVLPYARIAWFCLPPLFIKTDPMGNLHCEDGPAIKWADGYSLDCVYVPPSTEEEQKAQERELLEAEFGKVNPDNPTVKLLNSAISGLVKKNLEGSK